MSAAVTTCCAIVQEGKRKGEPCRFPPNATGYCGRHQRNRVHDEGVAAGKIWCRFFFRGCDNVTEKPNTACSVCRTPATPVTLCSHSGCKNKRNTEGGLYCMKHIRDAYRDKEKELGIRYCHIETGCFNICEGDTARCESCRAKSRTAENALYSERKKMHLSVADAHSKSLPPRQICCMCGGDFVPFLTRYKKASRHCAKCHAAQAKQDAKRADRKRDYKETHFRHPEASFNEYFKNAIGRKLVFELTLEQFTELIKSPCYYCGQFKAGEAVGVDRFDNTKGYTAENARPCCGVCNKMKHSFHPLFFIEKSRILAGFAPATPEFFEKWSIYYARANLAVFCSYKASAARRKLPFELTHDEFNWLVKKPCYMCGYTGAVGIDRRDSSKGYHLANCSPCCYSCNMTKWDVSYEDLLQKSMMICSMWKETSSIEVPMPGAKPLRAPKKHWKASSVHLAFMSNNYGSFIESLKGVATKEEIDALYHSVCPIPYDDGIRIIQTFLNTCNARRKKPAAKAKAKATAA